MLYILHGSDPVARKEALDELKSSLDKDGALATNTTHLEAARTTPQEVMAACDTVPFLGEHRLVIVEGLLALASRGGRRVAAGDDEGIDEEPPPDAGRWDALAEHIPDMPPSTTLVLLDGSITAGNALLKKFGPLGEVRQFSAPGERDVAGWVTARAKKLGLKFDPRAARLLAELIGPDPQLLASEMEKLGAYANGEVVREEEVRELIGRAKEQKGYFLADAVAEGKGATAARLLQEMIEDGTPLPVILSTLAGRYRRMAVVKEMMERGASGGEIARRLRMKQNFGLDKLMDMASRHSWAAIRAAYDRIVQSELDLKSGLMEDQLCLELVVQELASRPTRAA